tara:strand:- start:37970 stop:38224 length:255 start_codon:yes stop_codon:yes gene_type:complete
MTSNIIDITAILAVKELQPILELSKADAVSFYANLTIGLTLAEALRSIGINSASEVGLERWPELREWRERYFPTNIKSPAGNKK